MKDVTNAKQIEEVKREYYKTRVNSRLDAAFVLENEEHKQEFLELCKYVGTLLAINEIYKAKGTGATLVQAKHMLYFAYIVCFPMRSTLPCMTMFITAHLISTIQRSIFSKRKDPFVSLMLSCEEQMHLYWFLSLVLLSW